MGSPLSGRRNKIKGLSITYDLDKILNFTHTALLQKASLQLELYIFTIKLQFHNSSNCYH